MNLDTIAGVKRCRFGHPVQVDDMMAFTIDASEEDFLIMLRDGADCDDCRQEHPGQTYPVKHEEDEQ